MSEAIDLVYDRLVADERLKAGTKYERLAAIAFRHVTGRETVHDLRLRGGTGVAHQIDAVVGDERKRILIESPPSRWNTSSETGPSRDAQHGP